jgi:hypothetical protein
MQVHIFSTIQWPRRRSMETISLPKEQRMFRKVRLSSGFSFSSFPSEIWFSQPRIDNQMFEDYGMILLSSPSAVMKTSIFVRSFHQVLKLLGSRNTCTDKISSTKNLSLLKRTNISRLRLPRRPWSVLPGSFAMLAWPWRHLRSFI